MRELTLPGRLEGQALFPEKLLFTWEMFSFRIISFSHRDMARWTYEEKETSLPK